MRTIAPVRPPVMIASRIGYTVAAVIDATMLYLINVRPGWQAVPFLTGDVPQVLGLVNLSIIVGLVANMIYMAYDPKWLRSLGELVTTVISLAMLVRVLRIFPFAFAGPSIDWALIVRTVLVVAAVATAVAAVVNLFRFLRWALGR